MASLEELTLEFRNFKSTTSHATAVLYSQLQAQQAKHDELIEQMQQFVQAQQGAHRATQEQLDNAKTAQDYVQILLSKGDEAFKEHLDKLSAREAEIDGRFSEIKASVENLNGSNEAMIKMVEHRLENFTGEFTQAIQEQEAMAVRNREEASNCVGGLKRELEARIFGAQMHFD